MAKLHVFEVPVQDATPMRVIPGRGMPTAANEDVPLRERPPVVEARGLMITFNRSGIFISAVAIAAITAWCITHVFLLAAWLFGFGALNHHFLVLGGLEGMWRTVAGFASGVGMLCGGLFLWAFYNWLKFHGPDRRRAPRPVCDEVIADHYGLPANFLWRWQFSRRIIAHHDERGIVSGAESDSATWIRDKSSPRHIIKPNTFDILYLSARSKLWRKEAGVRKSNVR